MRKYILTGAVITSILSMAVGVARMAGVDIPITDEQIATIGNAVAGIGGVVLSVLIASATRGTNSANVDRVGTPAEDVSQKPPGPDQKQPVGDPTSGVHPIDPFRDHGA